MNKLMIFSSWFGHLLNVSPLCGLYPVADALVPFSTIIPLNCAQQPYMNKLMICSSWFGHLLNVSPLCGLYPVADALVLPISSDRCPNNGALYAGQCAASHAFNSLKGHSNEKGLFYF